MTIEQYFKNLNTPTSNVDVVLDTDTYNEIDDQFALAYLLRSDDKLNIKGICAAPFFNSRSTSAADGMERSYQEIFKVLELAKRTDLNDIVYRGSERFLENEETPVISDAARLLAEFSQQYTSDNPLYIIALGAITNVASAFLLNPNMKENTVVVWLGGHALHRNHTREFNMIQDVAAARVVFGCGVPLVLLPCSGVVDQFLTTRYELEHWLLGKNELCDYLFKNTVEYMDTHSKYPTWSKVIWDVTAVAWLLNDKKQFMNDRLEHCPIPEYDNHYSFDHSRHMIQYVYNISRDALFADLFEKLTR